MDFLDFSRLLKELRLMHSQPAYRFHGVAIGCDAAEFGLCGVASGKRNGDF